MGGWVSLKDTLYIFGIKVEEVALGFEGHLKAMEAYMMKKTLPVLTLALAIPGLAQGDPEVMWVQSGFDQPESVVSDAEGAHLYVSNIHGQPGEKNAQGYISKLTNDGEVVERHWVKGLNAPKGMGVDGGKLFVTDIDRFLVIDLGSGEILEQFSPSQAQFLNDVSVSDNGDVYVSDMMGSAIYRYDGEALTRWIEDDRLMHPNGVLADDGSLLVAGWGGRRLLQTSVPKRPEV